VSAVDLHIHSKWSGDGELPVSSILEMCKSAGIKLLSITDHNSVRGAGEALQYSKGSGLRVIPGVELDCTHNELNLHLLGYGIDHTLCEFSEIEASIISQEKGIAEEKLRLFQKATGISLESEINEIIAASDGFITGEVIAERLLKKENASDYEILKPYLPGGAKSDMPNAWFYWDFFSPGKPAYIPIKNISLCEAISLIKKAGGIPVLAHPGQSLSGNYNELNGIIAEGVCGIEVFSSYHAKETAEYFLGVAAENGILITCGSDFHGKNKPNIRLGDHGSWLPDSEIIKNIEEKLQALTLP